MGVMIPLTGTVMKPIDTSKSIGMGGYFTSIFAHQRAPTDAFFFANVVVQNAVVGSAYMLGYLVGATPSGAFTPLAGFSGTVSNSDFTLSNVPSYESPMLLELRLRKGTSGAKYQPFKINAVHSSNGVTIYCSQVADPIA